MFHLCKQSRMYYGYPYSGPSGEAIGKRNEPLEFESLDEAIEASKKLNKFNPVGWNVFDSDTRGLVYGIDFFGDTPE